MSQLVRTTITIPEDLVRMLKMKAVVEKTSLSGMITKIVRQSVQKSEVTREKEDPMKSLGVFKIGIDKVYDSRDELYEDHLKRKMGI